MKESDLHRAARERIEEYGWIQGHYYLNGGFCLFGAHDDAVQAAGWAAMIEGPTPARYYRDTPQGREHEDWADLTSITWWRLCDLVDDPNDDPIGWNDEPGRTVEDVLLLFKRAEAAAAEEEQRA